MANTIHPTAVIEPGAELGDSVTVGAYSVIGEKVRIGDGTTIGPHVVIQGRTTIGRDNRVFQFASLGAIPQDKKYKGEDTELVIGDRNLIREFVTFNLGTAQDGGVTRIGNDNWIMAYVHFGHDCQLGDHITISNSTQLAGHVTVGDWVTLGGVTLIHQFCKIGAHVMTGMGSAIAQDVPPFMITTGAPAEVRGLNSEGLRRRGFSPERLAVIKQMHKLLYRQGLTFEAAREAITALAGTVPEADGDVALMTQFFTASTRGILR